MFTYMDEFIEDMWEQYENYLYDNSTTDCEDNRIDFTQLKADAYLAFVEEMGEVEYTGDEGYYED